MIRSNFQAILDACVILPMPLADTLLRFAEHPRLYIPRWSIHILTEVERNLESKWGKSREQARNRTTQMRAAFPEATVDGYESLIVGLTIDEKDRHVLAAAILSGSSVIVTSNLRHFPRAALQPFGIEAQSPGEFLISLYDLDPGLAVAKLSRQASNVGFTLEKLLVLLSRSAPEFTAQVAEASGLNLSSDDKSAIGPP